MDIEKTLEALRRDRDTLDAVIEAVEKVMTMCPVMVPWPRKGKRGRKSMGAEERMMVSERMKKYWAARRESPQAGASR